MRFQNYQFIGQSLDTGISAFILILKDHPKIDQKQQEMLTLLHRWTMGQIWKNLIIMIRTRFDEGDLNSRALNDQNYWNTDSAKHEMLNLIVEKAAEPHNNWIIEENGKEKPLTFVSHTVISLFSS